MKQCFEPLFICVRDDGSLIAVFPLIWEDESFDHENYLNQIHDEEFILWTTPIYKSVFQNLGYVVKN